MTNDALRVLAAEFAESSTRAHTVANMHNPASESGKLEIAIARTEARTWAAAQAAVNRVLTARSEDSFLGPEAAKTISDECVEEKK